MKKSSLKMFLAGALSATMVVVPMVSFAETSETISAIFGRVKLVVNGENVDKETLLYKGATYVPLRAAAEMLGATVDWDAATNTASIKTVEATTVEATTEATTEAVTVEAEDEDTDDTDYSTITDEATKGSNGEYTLKGTVVDAAMNTVVVKTAKGSEFLLLTEDAEKDFKKGLLVDGTITVTFKVASETPESVDDITVTKIAD